MEEQLVPFTERFQAIYRETPPEYVEMVLLVTLVVTLVGAVVFALFNRMERNRLVGRLASERGYPGEPSDSTRMDTKLAMLGLVGLYYAAALVTLFTIRWGATVQELWIAMGRTAVGVGGAFVISLLLYGWLWYTLFEKPACSAWFRSYYLTSIIFALSLFIPLIIYLVSPDQHEIAKVIMAVLFLLYRLLVVWQTLRFFTRLRRSPLHIILYLCAYEIGPIYLLTRWAW